jgi:hypothetical protein
VQTQSAIEWGAALGAGRSAGCKQLEVSSRGCVQRVGGDRRGSMAALEGLELRPVWGHMRRAGNWPDEGLGHCVWPSLVGLLQTLPSCWLRTYVGLARKPFMCGGGGCRAQERVLAGSARPAFPCVGQDPALIARLKSSLHWGP